VEAWSQYILGGTRYSKPVFYKVVWFGGRYPSLNLVMRIYYESENLSERSACAARSALQTGCVANVVATKFVVFFSSLFLSSSLFLRLITFLQEGVVLGSCKFVCALIRVKLDELAREIEQELRRLFIFFI
jgi:hypothetical protein